MTAPRTISVIRGDGIGPEITDATLRVLDALDSGLQFEFVEAGLMALEKHGDLLPAATMDSSRRHGVALKAVSDLGGGGSTGTFAEAIIERIGHG